MQTYDVQTVSLTTGFDRAFRYIANPENLPHWTSAFKQVAGRRARMATPRGEVTVQLEVVSNAASGQIDWRMTFPDGSVGKAYSRLVPNGERETIYSFVLLAPPAPLEELEGALEQQKAILREELKHLQERLT